MSEAEGFAVIGDAADGDEVTCGSSGSGRGSFVFFRRGEVCSGLAVRWASLGLDGPRHWLACLVSGWTRISRGQAAGVGVRGRGAARRGRRGR